MTNTPTAALDVIWWARHPGIPASDYWDHGDLLRLFAGEWPHPTPWPTMYHHVVEGEEPMPLAALDDDGGAVVVVPARYHATGRYYDRLNADLAELQWVLLILTGDEEHLFDPTWIRHPNMRLWIMTPSETLYGTALADTAQLYLGEGSPPGITEVLEDVIGERSIDVQFAGQVTHARRLAMYHAALGLNGVTAMISPTEGFTQGLEQDQYWRELACSKLVLCPSGPVTPSSFRVWEALEAGAIPIVDGFGPRMEGQSGDYWRLVLGDDHPLPVISNWEDLQIYVDLYLVDWERRAAEISAWWQQRKWLVSASLALTAGRLGELDFTGDTGAAITVVITTSPIPLHPSTETIAQTIASVRRQPGLSESPIVILADGVRDEQSDRARDYAEYLRRLTELTNLHIPNAVPWLNGEHRHQALTLRDGLAHVTTPYTLVMEHDTPLTDEIDWDGVVRWLALPNEEGLNSVRFHHEGVIPEEHWPLHLEREPIRHPTMAPIIRTSQWSQRPHLVRTAWYRQILAEYFGDESRTFVEDVMHGVVDQAYREHGVSGWERFRLGIYAPMDGRPRSAHSDGRGEDPKYPLRFEYPDGTQPEGAPRASSSRETAP